MFDKLPEPRRNEVIHETFVPAAKFEPPADAEALKAWWLDRQPKLKAALTAQVFRGWATDPAPLNARVAADVTHDGVRLLAIDFMSEAEVPLRMWVATAVGAERPGEIILRVEDDAGWKTWCESFGPAFAATLRYPGKLARNDAMFAQNRAAMPKADTSGWVPPAAIARLIAFLVSPEGGVVTGAAIPATGPGGEAEPRA